ncbi:hypothetical protein HU200_061996 [Digitaria exilis]|uniref:Solute carrier family 35 member F1 n=1 Tax=Digitaria exilis TaxID=1010633 RepID=A0A835A3V9_9POAL|nr:hypothetical protein HU200_061996 [Digitaria exilis]
MPSPSPTSCHLLPGLFESAEGGEDTTSNPISTATRAVLVRLGLAACSLAGAPRRAAAYHAERLLQQPPPPVDVAGRPRGAEEAPRGRADWVMAPPPEVDGGAAGGRFCGGGTRWVLLGLALGQFVSLLITSTGFASSELARRGINAPTSQSLLNYILLALVYGGVLLYRRQPLTIKWYYYLILGIIDVEANYIEGPNPLKGDLLVIFGSMFYACSNVTEEYVVKKGNRVELMAMLGLFGAIVSAIQISILERNELHSITWNAGAVLPFLGYAVVMFLFYSTVPTVLKICGATMLNLSLLTSDMWAVLIRIFAYHEKVDWIYFVAFACTAAGIIIYSYKYVSTVGYGGILACLKTWFSISTDTETEASGILVARRGSKEAENTAQVAGASDEQGKQGDEEAGAENPA